MRHMLNKQTQPTDHIRQQEENIANVINFLLDMGAKKVRNVRCFITQTRLANIRCLGL